MTTNTTTNSSTLPVTTTVPELYDDQSLLGYYDDGNLTDEDLFFGQGHSEYPPIKQPSYMIFVFSLAYLLIFLCALVGNTMVVIVVVRTPRMRSVTNYLIANLAVADILVAVFCIPITLLSNIFSGWPFGAFLCKSTPYLQGVSVCASVYTLAAIALDRYLAICHNPQWRITHQTSRILITSIWLLGAGLLVPWAVFYEQFLALEGVPMCHEIWPDFFSQRAYFVGAIFVGTYLFPLFVVLVCYIFIGYRVWNRRAPGVPKDNRLIRRSKLKVVKMLAVMVSLFALSWLPLHAIYLKLYYRPSYDQTHLSLLYNVAIPIAQWLELSNSGINPIVYCFFSKNFRTGFRRMWCLFFRFRRGRGWGRGRGGGGGRGLQLQQQRHLSSAYSSTTKYMTIEYYNGNVTITFRRDNREDSSSTI
ncbi:neuropeptide SIFamide receptor-like [Babylonia areolata]|uniref:neuropeptide SIFamide receptor-like n=1 Tax=Babylonia areolata TaxID=304850 RepID=UPI003FD2C8EA